MITFFPGPSKVYKQTGEFLQDAFQQGILSISHRSETFTTISKKAITLLKEKLHVPQDYTVMFTSSATECWEIIAQSLVKQESLHVYSGAFGEKWYSYAAKLLPGARGIQIGDNEFIDPLQLPIIASTEILCLTHNETSNATQVKPEILRAIRQQYPELLIAMDATSSMAGVYLPFSDADIWYASVQKCFGMPAGLGILICSPRAIEKMKEVGENEHYNSLKNIYDNIQQWQTNYTPNVLNIYLLSRIMEMVPDINKVEARIKEQALHWYRLINRLNDLHLLVNNPDVQSDTVIAVKASKEIIADIKSKAKSEGILLGSGYGSLKETTFRIANFPAIEEHEIDKLTKFLENYKFNS
jgi:phosphoserine aminotransferase